MSQPSSPTTAVGIPLELTLAPREPRFVVRLPPRLPRAGSTSLQVPLHRVVHEHLREVVSGSLNHALIALVRLALHWLDEDGQCLTVRTPHDPLNRSRAAIQARKGLLAEEWLTAGRLFSEMRRNKVTIEIEGRPPRDQVVFLQVGLPDDLRVRLVEEGIGSISQQFVYLARYALMRLELTNQTLHVGLVDAVTKTHPAESPEVDDEFGPIETVGQLIRHLASFPDDWPIRLDDAPPGWDGRIHFVTAASCSLGDDKEEENVVFLHGDRDYEEKIERLATGWPED